MDYTFDRSRTEQQDGTGRNPLFWGILLFSMLLKYGYYGLSYFPTVDDHNMYGIFSQMSPIDALEKYKMYMTRPLAGLLDAFVISRLWGMLWVVLLVFTLMHFASTYMLYKVLEQNYVRTGAAFAVVFALFPFGTDATYWIAASSRIVAGLFFAALSFYLFMMYIESGSSELRTIYSRSTGSNRDRIRARLSGTGFIFFNLISLGFYEQVVVFSFAGLVLLIAVNFTKLRSKWLAAVPFVNLGLIGAWYMIFRNTGDMAQRGQLLKSDFFLHASFVYKRIKALMTIEPASMLKNGFLNGFHLLLNDRAFVFLALVAAVSIALGIIYARERVGSSWKGIAVKFVLGLLLLILPLSLFFILEDGWVTFRNLFLPLIGIGLLAETFLSAVFSRFDLRILRGVLAGGIVFILIIVNVSEVSDYRKTYETDKQIVNNLKTALEGEKGQAWDKYDVLVFDTQSTYFTPSSGHFSNCTGSDWALAGAVKSILRQEKNNKFFVVPNWKKAPVKALWLDRCILLGIDKNMNVFPVKAVAGTEGGFELHRKDGSLFGYISVYEDQSFLFKLPG